MRLSRISLATSIALALGGCGLTVAQLPEVWERWNDHATQHMALQIKRAIFCQLKKGESKVTPKREPWEQWGAQVTLTLTADEKSSLTPNVSFKDPISPGRAFGQNVTQSFTLGAGGNLTSQNVRYDKYTFYFVETQLKHDAENICGDSGDDFVVRNPGGNSTSSPFVDVTNLGLAEWLPAAVAVLADKPRSTPIGKKSGSTGSKIDSCC